jgi:hypothetical protein
MMYVAWEMGFQEELAKLKVIVAQNYRSNDAGDSVGEKGEALNSVYMFPRPGEYHAP